MEVEPLDAASARDWDAFCREQAAGWFWHTTAWSAFMRIAKPELEIRSLAFWVRDGEERVAAVPLMLERDGAGVAFGLGGGPAWAPALRAGLDEARTADVLRCAFDHVDALAREHDAARARFALSPVVPGFDAVAPRFAVAGTRAGYADLSRVTQVLDPSVAPDALRRAMSKGHRAAITRGLKALRVELGVGAEAFDAYRALYERAAGRVVRPPAAFALEREWAAAGDGVLALARRDGRAVGATYVLRCGAGAYYLAAAVDPELRQEPVGHALQWAAIEWLRERGVTRYELGIQPFGPLPHEVPTDKERAIGRYKRGFGGVARPLLVREKWFSAAAARAELMARAAAYAAALEPSA